jgi:hypothetical protein
MATLIIDSTIEKVTAEDTQLAARLPPNTARSFMVRQCTIYTATKHPGDADK